MKDFLGVVKRMDRFNKWFGVILILGGLAVMPDTLAAMIAGVVMTGAIMLGCEFGAATEKYLNDKHPQ